MGLSLTLALIHTELYYVSLYLLSGAQEVKVISAPVSCSLTTSECSNLPQNEVQYDRKISKQKYFVAKTVNFCMYLPTNFYGEGKNVLFQPLSMTH